MFVFCIARMGQQQYRRTYSLISGQYTSIELIYKYILLTGGAYLFVSIYLFIFVGSHLSSAVVMRVLMCDDCTSVYYCMCALMVCYFVSLLPSFLQRK